MICNTSLLLIDPSPVRCALNRYVRCRRWSSLRHFQVNAPSAAVGVFVQLDAVESMQACHEVRGCPIVSPGFERTQLGSMSTIDLVDPELRGALALWPVEPLTANSLTQRRANLLELIGTITKPDLPDIDVPHGTVFATLLCVAAVVSTLLVLRWRRLL